MARDWKGLNSAAFEGDQRHAMDAVSAQLHELSASVGLLAANKTPGTTSLSSAERRLAQPGGSTVVNRTTVLPDGDYGDVSVASPGTQLTVEGWGGHTIVRSVAGLLDAIAFMSSGGTIYIVAGLYELSSTLVLNVGNMKLIGAGQDMTYFRVTDYNTDIISIQNHQVTVSHMSLQHTPWGHGTGNGKGLAGSGRGIVFEMETTTSDNYGNCHISHVNILNTASWGIYDTGGYAMEDISYGDGFASAGLFSNTPEHPFPIWGYKTAIDSTVVAGIPVPANVSAVSTWSANSRTITSTGAFTNVRVGNYVYDVAGDIQHGTYVTAKASDSSITISKDTIGAGTGVTLYFSRRTNCRVTVDNVIDEVNIAFTNSGGAMYLGYACTTTKISGLKTNNYSFGSFCEHNDTAPTAACTRGAVDCYGGTVLTFYNPIFQSPSKQSGSVGTPHDDTDATMLSVRLNSNVHFYSPYFEVLSGNCEDGRDWYHPYQLMCQKNSNTTVDSAGLFGPVSIGMRIAGTGIPPDTYVTGKASANQITISQAATDSVLENLTFSHDTYGYRQYWLITGSNSLDVWMDGAYFGCTTRRLDPTWQVPAVTGSYYGGFPARLVRTLGSGGGFNFTMRGGRVAHQREFYSAIFGHPVPTAPYEYGDFYPCPEMGTSTSDPWDNDDFLFHGTGDGSVTQPITIEDLLIQNYSTGQTREPTVPTGTAISNRPCFRMHNNGRNLKLGVWTDVAAYTGGTESMDNVAERTALSQDYKGGLLAYVAGLGDGVGSIQREGLWGVSTADHNWKQIPWIRKHTSIWSPVYAGDLWMKLSNAVGPIYTSAVFQYYDGAAWRRVAHATDSATSVAQNLVAFANTDGASITELTGTQGDVLYYNGTNWAKLAAGTSGYYLKTNGAGANPSWAAAATSPTTTKGDLIVRGNAGVDVRLPVGTDGYRLTSNSAATNGVEWATNIVRRTIWIPAQEFNSTAATLHGTLPDGLMRIEFPASSDLTVVGTFLVPYDFDSNETVYLWYAGGGDTTAVSWVVYTLGLTPGVSSILGTYGDSATFSENPSSTANRLGVINISSAFTAMLNANQLCRVAIKRDTAADSNADPQQFLGISLEYDAVA